MAEDLKLEEMEDGSKQWVRGETRREKDSTLRKLGESELQKSNYRRKSGFTDKEDYNKFLEHGDKFYALGKARSSNLRKWAEDTGRGYAKGGMVRGCGKATRGYGKALGRGK